VRAHATSSRRSTGARAACRDELNQFEQAITQTVQKSQQESARVRRQILTIGEKDAEEEEQ
jgi:hypothetical protein